jgi:hypothetical protein
MAIIEALFVPENIQGKPKLVLLHSKLVVYELRKSPVWFHLQLKQKTSTPQLATKANTKTTNRTNTLESAGFLPS